MTKILIFLLGLVALSSSVNWQAAGNWTSDNMTFIWQTIDNTLNQVANGNTQNAPNVMSGILNTKWHPAWNVAVIKPIVDTHDAVVYGYAFNNHWFWVNNYGPAGFKYNIVIWKDYNCDKWSDINTPLNSMSSSARSTTAQNTIGPIFNFPNMFDDPWAAGKSIVDKMQTAFPGEAYSVIVQQGEVNVFSSTVCFKSDYILAQKSALIFQVGTKYVNYLVFRTR